MNEKAATNVRKNRITHIKNKFKKLILRMLINKFKRMDSKWN